MEKVIFKKPTIDHGKEKAREFCLTHKKSLTGTD